MTIDSSQESVRERERKNEMTTRKQTNQSKYLPSPKQTNVGNIQ